MLHKTSLQKKLIHKQLDERWVLLHRLTKIKKMVLTEFYLFLLSILKLNCNIFYELKLKEL